MATKSKKSSGKKLGRPSVFSDKLAEKICLALIDGQSMRSICSNGKFPAASTVFGWLADGKHPEFLEQYARTRAVQADILFDEILEIADDDSKDLIEEDEGDKKRMVPNHANVQRARLQVDVRKWMVGKLAPKKYGDRVEMNHSGNLGFNVGLAQRIKEGLERVENARSAKK